MLKKKFRQILALSFILTPVAAGQEPESAPFSRNRVSHRFE